MIQWIITSSVLILIVIMLRFILRGKISLKLQYALWLVVLIRLIVPVALFESPISVMNVFSKIDTKQITETVSAENEHEIVEDSDIIYTEYENTAPVSENILQNPNVDGNEVTKPAEQSFKFPEITAEGVWILGAAMTAMALLASNITFTAQLKRTRQPIATANTPLPVYFSPAVITPCMFGMFKPSIYVTETALSDDKIFSHVIAHETTHWKHRDNIWAILRCAALALHWYNPLVWVAAFLSLRDAELACDEDTIKEIGEDERVDYGRTLISLTTKKPMAGIMSTATTMTGSKNGIKERIMLIAKKPKVLKIAVMVLILAVAAAMVVTFSSPLMKEAEEKETVISESTYGSCVERDGKFYVLDLDGNVTGGPFDTMEYYSPEDGGKFIVFSNIGENNRREIVFNPENRAEWIETEDIRYTLYQMNFRKVNDIPFTSYYSYGYDPTTGAELSGVSDGVQYGYVFDRKTATYSLQSKAGDYTDFVSGNYDENNLVKSGDYYLLPYYYNANIFRPVFGLGDKNGNVVLEPRYNNISVLSGDRFLVREGEGAEQGDICGRSYIVDLTGKKLGNEYNDLEYIQLTNGWFIGIAKSYGSASEVELLDNSGENMNNEYWFGYWFVDENGMPMSDKYNEIRVYDDCFVKKDGKYLLDANSSVDVLSLKDAWISVSVDSYAFDLGGVSDTGIQKSNTETNTETTAKTEDLNMASSGIHVGAIVPFDKFVYPTIKEERLATEENIEEFENALSDFGLVSWIEITETADDISRNLTGTEVKRIYDILSTAELEIFDEHPNPNTGGALFIRGVKKNGKALWTLCYDFGNMVRICLDGETNYAFEVDRDAFKEIRTILEGSEIEGDVLRTKRGIFESTNPAKALPEVYACGNISLYSGDGKYFCDYGEYTGQYGFDFSNTIYDEAIETKTEYLGNKLKTVKTVEIVDKTDSTKFNINLYEFGFTLDGSAVEKLKAAGSDFAEAYTMDSFIWRNAVAGIEEKYLSAEDYGICWLGLIQPKRVESITVKDSVTGGEQKFTHNDGNHDEIAPIVDILRGLKAADEEHPYKNLGSISINIKFKTGISYNIEYYNGAIEIYADDLKKSVSYCVKDFEGVYNKLLKYAFGEYEYNYTVG